MNHRPFACSRRHFLKLSATLAAGAPGAWALAGDAPGAVPPSASATLQSNAKVAIAACRSYGPEVPAALRQSFDLLGGIGSLVKGQTVTVKINLTGTTFRPLLHRSVGETYMTHHATVMALTSLLFANGARRVRLVESTNAREPLEQSLVQAGFDVRALSALGRVEYENTRNLGQSKTYAHLRVPNDGHLFSAFDLNRSYEDTDVLVSLCKMKNHAIAGITLSMKNLFGITPNALYGDQAVTEEATAGRLYLHEARSPDSRAFPGAKPSPSVDPGYRIPRIVADLCAARPIHLAIIDGITTIRGGEGYWCDDIHFLKPGLLITGLNPVSTDAVGVAAMGYANPRATWGVLPFRNGDNHLLLAEQKGVGLADLSRIDVRGLSLAQAKCSFEG